MGVLLLVRVGANRFERTEHDGVIGAGLSSISEFPDGLSFEMETCRMEVTTRS